MEKEILTDEAADRFYRGRKKVKEFKKRINITNGEIQAKTGLAKNPVEMLFGAKAIKATVKAQQNLNVVVQTFHLNPNWVYGTSKEMLADTEALSQFDMVMLMMDTPEKRQATAERLNIVRKTDALTLDTFAKMVGVPRSTIGAWSIELKRTPKVIEALLTYCEKYGVNPVWLFSGKGHPREVWELKVGDKPVKRKRVKKWYIVNRTTLIPNHGWWIDGDGFQIKEGYKSLDVAKDYPAEYVTIDGRDELKIVTERAIASFRQKEAAEDALRFELRRIEREGNSAWRAPWSMETIR